MYKRDIYLDIDDNLNNYIKSVELDSNSRVWHFHLTVDYEPLDLTGKSVQFRAEKPDKTNVLNDCKIVDAEKGVVEVKLTRQVNAIPGRVKCLLKIIGDEGFVLKTKTFVVEVSKTLSDDTIVSSDEFGALEAALGKVQDIDNRFAQTNAQLSEKMDRGEMISVEQINKNLGKIDESYLSDTLLQQMAGNTPISAIPADKSIVYSKYANNSIDPFLHNFYVSGELKALNEKYPMNIDTSTFTLNVNSSLYCIFANRFITVREQSVSWSNEENPSYLRHFYVSPTTGLISVHASQDYDLIGKVYLFTWINDSIVGSNCVLVDNNVPKNNELILSDLSGIKLPYNQITLDNKCIDYTKLKMAFCTITNDATLTLDFQSKKLKVNNKYAFAYYDAGLLRFADTTYEIDITDKLALGQTPYIIYLDLSKASNEKLIFGTLSEYQKCNNSLVITFVYADMSTISHNHTGFILVDKNGNRKEFSYEKQLLNPSENVSSCPNVDNDGGYFNWEQNKFILPSDLYLIEGVDYNIYSANFNSMWYIDNDNLTFDIGLPTKFTQFKQCGNIRVDNLEGSWRTKITGMHKKFDYQYHKDITLNIKKASSVSKRELTGLCIGDSITHMNYPKNLKEWLRRFGVNVNLVGTINNVSNDYGYGFNQSLPAEKGEGRAGWRLTDFLNKTETIDGEIYNNTLNPFKNPSTNEFDFEYYMTNNNFVDVDLDFVIIQLGTNDIGGYSFQNEVQFYNPNYKTEYLNPESRFYIGGLYGKMIESIHAYDPNIKIAINPPCGAGITAVIEPALMWAEELQYIVKNYSNVYNLASYLFMGNLSTNVVAVGEQISDKNETLKVNKSFDVHPLGTGQSVHSLIGASWIINMF